MQDQEVKFKEWAEMLSKVENWWGRQMSIRISEFNFLQEKLTETWDEQKAERMNKLQSEINELLRRSTFEQNEIKKYESAYDKFINSQKKNKLSELSKKISDIKRKMT